MSYKRGYYDVFMKTCAKYPSGNAVIRYDNEEYFYYTYSELFGICEYISQNLQQLQCYRGMIGLLTDRNVAVPCIIAAAHKCCMTFMFLNPQQDIESISSSVKFNILITIDYIGNLRASNTVNKKPDRSITVFDLQINFYCITSSSVLNFHEHSYIAMTSGSTGEPKHIRVPIQCLEPNIDDLTKLFNIGPNDLVYFSTPLTFDPSMIEILMACKKGACLLIAPERADILFPQNKLNSITFWQTTPSKFFQYSDADIRNKILSSESTLKTLALGGEPLNGIRRLRELKSKENKTKIFALYGVTEMSCWASVAEIDLNKMQSDREVPLGTCLSETQLLLEPTPGDSNTGTIMLVSKTRNCVLLNKGISDVEQNTLQVVNTGDIGESKNGHIYYRGRKDEVVKRFGHKINLQSIEGIVMQCPKVKSCSCVWLPKPLLLIVYYSSETISSRDLSNFLKCKLDDKHWPDKIIRVDSLPVNRHGKVSKELLRKKYHSNHVLSLDFLKSILLSELREMLSNSFTYEEIKDKSFMSLGGTSFLAVTLSNKISLRNPRFGKCILPFLMSDKNTIAEIMSQVQKEVCVEETKKRVKRGLSSQSYADSIVSKRRHNQDISAMEFVISWSYDTGKCVDASPALFQIDSTAYVTVGSHSGKVVVANAVTGHVVGVIQLKTRIEATVLCSGGKNPMGLVGGHDGTVLCFQLRDCSQLWTTNLGSMVKSKAVRHRDLYYVASYDGNITCLDVETGEIRRVIPVSEQPISADLVVSARGFVIVASLGGSCASVATSGGGLAWHTRLPSPVFAAPALYDDGKYVVIAEVAGEIHCRTVEKGIKIWRYQGARGNIFSSLYVKQIEKLKWQMVFGCHDCHVYSIHVNNSQPSLHWKWPASGPVYSTPCRLDANRIVIAANTGTLSVLEATSSDLLGEYQLPNETFSSPAVHDNHIVIGCRNDHLFSLKYTLNVI